MGDLFDIANLITKVGVDAVKIKPEPGLPEKSSNEILTELFSTFDVSDGEDDDEDENNSESSNEQKDGDKANLIGSENAEKVEEGKIKKEKNHEEDGINKKKKVKKKHKHKSEGKDKEKKHKHKKKSKHYSSETDSDSENGGSKKKKKKKKSKRKHDSDENIIDSGEPSLKLTKLEKSSRDTSKDTSDIKDKLNFDGPEMIKIKKEKVDQKEETKASEEKERSPALPLVSKILDDDAEAVEVPKLLEKTKNSLTGKILIKDLKNSEVFNNTVKEIENQKKEKAERMEDGEITDSDDDYTNNANNNNAKKDSNRTPTLSPTPPLERVGGMRSDRRKFSTSPSPSRRITKKTDLRLMLREKEKKKKQGESSRSRSKSNRNNEKSSRSKERKDNRSRSCHSRDKRTRSRSGDRGRHGRGRSRERRDSRRSSDRDRHIRDVDKYKSRSEDRNKNKSRGRSRSKERKERIEIDKKKLLEIARRNAINMIIKGKLPLAQQDKAIAAIQAGGKTIDELTDFCKSISKSEAMGELSSISSDDESGSEKGFHHPFLIKERPSSIIMNIRDSKQLPTKTLLEKTTEATNQLRLQFPVSSGQQHRKNETEWIPVTPAKPSRHSKPEPKKLFIPAKEILHNAPLPLVVPPLTMQTQSQPLTQPSQSVVPYQSVTPVQTVLPYQPNVQNSQTVPVASIEPMQQQIQHDSIFPAAPVDPIDISTIVSQRLAAMRKLSENPNDVQALNEMYKAQNGMKSWIESKQIPGQFTGSTGAKVLTPAELNSGHQAWARKDQLLTAQPVSGGMGMALLQKMGWRPGEGLGKNKEGTLEPLQLEVKLDKRGLISDQDIGAAKLGKVPKSAVPTVKTLEGKHPVSLLGEFCSKRKFGAPVYELCFECGPDHKKNFLFKVKVNGIEYKPAVASPNKKLAKAEAAQVCLQTIGLLP